MGKKKFFDKKKSATFQLMARDTSDPNYSAGPSGERVFVRVDNNQYTPAALEGSQNDPDFADPDSIYADAPDDNDDEDQGGGYGATGLPDHVRREILELGFPDDGYNYLAHVREITGGSYFENPKATDVHVLPRDVKAYDATRVKVSNLNDAAEKAIYSVASKTVNARLNKVLDPEVAAMLDDSNSSDFGSDVEDLEEDFVVQANHFEGSDGEEHDEDEKLRVQDPPIVSVSTERSSSYVDNEKPRVRRPLDEQFDLLELNEYGSDNEEDFNGYMDEEDCQESLTEKLSSALKHHNVSHLDNETLDDAPPESEVIQRCREYAEKFEDQDDDREVVLVEESSDESEVWDCETIVTTYSTLDNHPGKIGAPEARRKKKLAEALSGSATGTNQVITLKGKERLPVDFLPSRKRGEEKTKDETKKKSEVQIKKPRAQETKEEKKERKSAVKVERREARLLKKEVKVVYKSEAHHAQKVAASTGPSSIHLM